MVSATAHPLELRQGHARQTLRARFRALSLTFPLIAFLIVFFLAPISYMLFYSVWNPKVRAELPHFYATLYEDTSTVPGEPVFRAFAQDVSEAAAERRLPPALEPFRIQDTKMWQLIWQTSQKLPAEIPSPAKHWFVSADPRWAEPSTWTFIRRAAKEYTPHYFLHTFDFRFQPDGSIERKPLTEQAYTGIFINTFEISIWVTVFAFILGYPLAYYLASLRENQANLLLIFVLIPFWTSVLVRAYAWLVVLQSGGPINKLLLATNLTNEPLTLIHNRVGVYVAMTHVLLPFMILPIYSIMKTIPDSYVYAAYNLGAGPIRAFLRVYFPLTIPGVGAGTLLVFMLALGYYITPAIVGGSQDTMISMMIAQNINTLLNWGLAAALATVLLVITLIIFGLYTRYVRLDRLPFA